MPKSIAISMGDPNGIGPEIILRSLNHNEFHHYVPVVFGQSDVFEYYNEVAGLSMEIHPIESAREAIAGKLNIINCNEFNSNDLAPGKIRGDAGLASMKAVEAALKACLNKETGALVTAPISKEAISKAGYSVPGHTEFLAEKTGTDHVLMMLVSGSFRVALATIHIPVKDVAPAISEKNLERKLQILSQSLTKDYGIEKAKIAVLGLNPHGGDGGVIGEEEIRIIKPVVEKLRREGLWLSDPYAADAFFGKSLQNSFDAVFAMYHDQGLIPFKALTFGSGVNFTAGLPIIRTSPDHGTAFDIAGKNIADTGSFMAALRLAADLVERNESKNSVFT